MYAYDLFRLAWKRFIGDAEVTEHFIVNDGKDNLSVRYRTPDGVSHEWSIPMGELYAKKPSETS